MLTLDFVCQVYVLLSEDSNAKRGKEHFVSKKVIIKCF